jgi:NADH-quinone oxidoreductase subunit M
MLYLYQRTMFGKVDNPKNERLTDLTGREFATFAPLIILAVWIGLYPAPFLRRLDTSVQRVVARVSPQYRPGTLAASPQPSSAPARQGASAPAAAQGQP